MKIKKLTLNNFMAFGNAEMNWADNINEGNVFCNKTF